MRRNNRFSSGKENIMGNYEYEERFFEWKKKVEKRGEFLWKKAPAKKVKRKKIKLRKTVKINSMMKNISSYYHSLLSLILSFNFR